MKDERKLELFNEAMGWVYDHAPRNEYIRAMKSIGFTNDEIYEELETNYGIDITDEDVICAVEVMFN